MFLLCGSFVNEYDGGLSLLSCLIHLIIYRMIKSFKQPFVLFVITTRKFFAICISLVFYRHKTHSGQIIRIMIVLGVVIYEFYSELVVSRKMVVQNQIPPVLEYELQELNYKDGKDNLQGPEVQNDFLNLFKI